MDKQGYDIEALTRGSAAKEGDDGEFAPDIVSNLPLVVSGIGLRPAEVQLGTTDCVVARTSGQGSEDSKKLYEVVECNDRELVKSDKDEGDDLKGNKSLLTNSAQLLKSFFAPSGLTSSFVMGSKVGTSRRMASKHGNL